VSVGPGRTAGAERTDVSRDTTVLVVDDQRAFADAVGLAVDSQRHLRCIGTVGTAEEAVERVVTARPDVVLLDLQLPGMAGLDAIPIVKERCPGTRVLVLTVDTTRATILAAAAAGADGFLPKDAPFAAILDAVRATDSILVADEVLEQIVHLVRRDGGQARADDTALTERELEVLRHLANGVPVKQIARRLGISVYTCRGHVRAILHKLGAHSQLAAVVVAARRGLLHDLGAWSGSRRPERRGAG
jgi:DNA-binding NarL/FixJ family response regulator